MDVLAAHSPRGSRLELVTPFGDSLLTHLEEQGELTRGGFLKAPVAWVLRGDENSGFRALADLCDTHSLEPLAVWFTVFAADGLPLIEAEDGNDALFLGEGVDEDLAAKVLASVNAVGPGGTSGSLRQPSGSAF